MEQRRQKRLAVGYKAEIVCSGKHYEGVIENLSSTGVNILINPAEPETGFMTGKTIELKFEPCPGETVSLMCKVMWHRKTAPHNLSARLGLEFIDPQWDQCSCII
ncbi:MAG: PilZ domain-containing protein [Nitrospiraceae bacterium]|nr:MAG: PilZ domain-containing protein [Nitrospiraceae bacterium]